MTNNRQKVCPLTGRRVTNIRVEEDITRAVVMGRVSSSSSELSGLLLMVLNGNAHINPTEYTKELIIRILRDITELRASLEKPNGGLTDAILRTMEGVLNPVWCKDE